MSALFRLLVVRRILIAWPRTLLLLLGLSLSVAVALAIIETGSKSIESFEVAARSFAGGVSLRSRTGRFSSAPLHSYFRRLPSQIVPFAVREEAATLVNGSRTLELSVVGIDGLVTGRGSEEPSIMLPTALRRALDAESGSVATLILGDRTREVTVTDIPSDLSLAIRSDTAIVSLAWLDQVSDRSLAKTSGFVDYIVFSARDGVASLKDFTEAFEGISREFPWLELVTDDEQRERTYQLLGAFRLNILVMIAMTALVCSFTVFNASFLSVRGILSDIGTLRTLGLARRRVIGIVLGESLLVAAAGWILGVSLARPLTVLAAGFIARTTETLYGGSGGTTFVGAWPEGGALIVTACGSIIMAVLGAVLPARNASRVKSGVTSIAITDASPPPGRGFLIGAVGSAILATAFASLAWQWELPLLAHLSVLSILLSILLVSPGAIIFASSLIHWVARATSSVATLLVGSEMRASSRTASFALGGLATTTALLVGLGTMIGSFRTGLIEWLDYTIRGDVFLSSARNEQGSLPLVTLESIAAMPQVVGLSRSASHSETVCGPALCRRSMLVGGIDLVSTERQREFHLLQGRFDREAFGRGEEILLSESGARHLKVGAGSEIRFAGKQMRVQGIFKDFSSDRGLILGSFEWYRTTYGVSAADTASIYLTSPLESARVQSDLRSLGLSSDTLVRNQKELKEAAVTIFDQTFEITFVMRGVIVILCLCGFAITLFQVNWERRQELRTLQVLGLSSRELSRVILGETLLLTGAASVLGIVAGIAVAYVLVAILNPLSFGWSFDIQLQPSFLGIPVLVAISGSVICAVVMLRQTHRMVRSATLAPE